MILGIDFTGRGYIRTFKTNMHTSKQGEVIIMLEPEEIQELKTKFYKYAQCKKGGIY